LACDIGLKLIARAAYPSYASDERRVRVMAEL
jgi:hypothetical protein